jgi:hypothetical protein
VPLRVDDPCYGDLPNCPGLTPIFHDLELSGTASVCCFSAWLCLLSRLSRWVGGAPRPLGFVLPGRGDGLVVVSLTRRPAGG